MPSKWIRSESGALLKIWQQITLLLENGVAVRTLGLDTQLSFRVHLVSFANT